MGHLLLFSYTIYHTEYDDYGSMIVPDTATLNQTSDTSCHSVIIYDDNDVELPETFFVNILPTGPSEFINLFDIVIPETVVRIADDDSELWEVIFNYYVHHNQVCTISSTINYCCSAV